MDRYVSLLVCTWFVLSSKAGVTFVFIKCPGTAACGLMYLI